eukprot:1140684-Pelagomonas_calceolata.AAC.1
MSLPHQRVRGKLVWVWWVSGIMQPHCTRVMSSISDLNGTPGRGYGSTDSPTHTQEYFWESDLGTLKLFAQFTMKFIYVVAVRLLAGHQASYLGNI